MPEDIVLEGWLSILSVLDGESRSLKIIYLQRNKKCASFARLLRRARQRQVPVNVVSRGFIESRASGASHGGAIALAGPRRYTPLDKLGREAAVPFIVMLDGIEDPFNFGQAIRAIYAAGADGLVVTNRNWGHAAGVVARASAGTSERMPTARVKAATEAVAHFRTRGLTIACTARWPGAIPLYGADLSQPLLLLIGGERRGIRRALLRQADMLVRIPYGAGFHHSLGATSATAVLVFEAMRQRRFKHQDHLEEP